MSCVGHILPRSFLIVVRIVGALLYICQLDSMCKTLHWKSLSKILVTCSWLLVFNYAGPELLKEKFSKLHQICIEVINFIHKMTVKCNYIVVYLKKSYKFSFTFIFLVVTIYFRMYLVVTLWLECVHRKI